MSDKNLKRLCIAASVVLSLLFILLIFSVENVDPANTNWVKNGGGDNLQHYLGWRYFRISGWNRFILFMRNLNYPVGTSVIVTDSNPLFSLIFKLFRNILPEQFQFNGIWIVLSYLLLAYFAALICYELTGNALLSAAGAALAVLNPVILQRALIHDTLTAHWLILAGIYLMLHERSRWNVPGWMILLELALLIHIYFVPMLLFILLLQGIRMLKRRRPAVRVVCVYVSSAAALAAGYFLFGYSHILPQSGSFGELSMNLNAFINPDSVPALLSPRPKISLQYEGFNYLGLGMLLLIIFGIFAGGKSLLRSGWVYALPSLFLILIAASQVGYFDQIKLYEVRLPESIYSALSVFRSSGRLVWPLYYLVLFALLRVISRKAIQSGSKSRKTVLEILVLFCVTLQILDLNEFHCETAERFRNPQNTVISLPRELTELFPEGVSHLFCSDGDAKTVDALALFAVDRKMTFNVSTNARGIEHVYGGDAVDLDHLVCGSVQPDSVYIYLSGARVPDDLERCEEITIRPVNDWVIISR